MRPTFITFLVLTLAIGGCSEEPTSGSIGQCLSCGGSLGVAPNPVIFESVQLGTTARIDVTLTNFSNSDTLDIRQIRLVEDTTDDPAGEELFPGDSWFRSALLEPGDKLVLEVEYRPADHISDSGRLELDVFGDDTINSTFHVPIRTNAIEPDIQTQSRIEFPTTAPNAPARFATAEVENVGGSPLVIRDVSLTGAEEFSVAFYRGNPDSSAPEPLPDRVEPGDSFWYRIFFEPTDRAPRSGKLTFLTNDPYEEFVSIAIEAPQAGPCISGSSARIDFGEANIGRVNALEYRVSNCADEPLTISRVSVADSDDSRFEVSSGSLPRAFPVVLEPDERLEFSVIFRPEETNESSGQLVIASDDPANPVLNVGLSGSGSSNRCPTASFAAIPVGESRASYVIPIDRPTRLDSSQSFDPDGQIDRYEWTILDAPAGSVPDLIPSAQSASPTIVPTAYGAYQLELQVFDDQGRASCSPARITVTTIPIDEIAVVLRWQTPGDPDPTDEIGPDVDLHFRHPLGEWNLPPYDIFGANPTADWGAGGPTGNPNLTEFDNSDSGPEILELGSPEFGLDYSIGAYVFDSRGMGASILTLDVFLRGVLVYSDTKTLAGREFWHAVDVSWPGGTLTQVDIITNGFP